MAARTREERDAAKRAKAAAMAAEMGGLAESAPEQVDVIRKTRAAVETRGRLEWVRLGSLHPSPRQTRRRLTGIEDLAASIRQQSLLAPPQVRPHPTIPGDHETIIGHRRIAALRYLAEAGQYETTPLSGDPQPILRRGATPEDALVPVLVDDVDDLTAAARTVSENLDREDLSPWEDALAVARLAADIAAAGGRTSSRGLAERLEGSKNKIAKLVRIASRLHDPAVLHAARLLPTADRAADAANDEPLLRLSADALDRAARPESPAARGQLLRKEIERDLGATQVPAKSIDGGIPVSDGVKGERSGPAQRVVPLQIVVRTPLEAVRPAAAAGHVRRLAPALGVLVQRSLDALDAAERQSLYDELLTGITPLRGAPDKAAARRRKS